MDKPLFVPLKREYFDAFERGDKDCEWRLLGPRWNDGTCYPGRRVVLSCGYGKAKRLAGRVVSTIKVGRDNLAVPDGARKIYPHGRHFIGIRVALDDG